MKLKTLVVALAAIGCTSCVGVTDKAMSMADSIMDKTITRTVEEGEFNKFYNFNNFSAIEAEGFCHIIFTQSEGYSVKVSSNYPEVLDMLKVDKSSKKLKLTSKKKASLKDYDDAFINVFVSAPVLEKVDMSGACGLTCDNLSVDNGLFLDVSGASNLKFGTVDCKSLNMDASGAVKVTGTFVVKNDVEWEASGAAIADLDFTADKIRLESSGAVKMDAKVNCKKLKVINDGAGTITLKGKAEKTDFSQAIAARINTNGLNR